MARRGGRLIRLRRRRGDASATEVLAALATPVLIVDAEGLVRSANGAAETLLNMSRQSIEGRPLEGLVGVSLADTSLDAPLAVYGVELRLPDARRHHADLSSAPVAEKAGQRVVTIHSRAPAHLSARRIDREGGALTAAAAAAMLAHEIKNPLSAIRGAAQLLRGCGDPAAADLTRLIRDEVDRIAALIDRMEGFTDERPIELSAQNIHAVLGHAREVALQGFAHGRTIREIYDPSLPDVLGHRDSLVQILINLLKNAAEASDSSTIILTTAYRHGMAVVERAGQGRRVLPIEVCVIDDGPGAPAAIAEHLFDPFVSSRRAQGGLGLALVDKLVADHGGMVEYAREGAPPRTVFRLLLPRSEDRV